ncbi:MAG TPA: Appr-1-p processing protein [Cyanobacteria bacterium UBA8553]|nr:Appr-1-p processing protein [Cyanobacteria bacterium UBA8553]HAJ59301.1 Appr-1-p processing protein [Cyanobacteria bacterium UBA8543]
MHLKIIEKDILDVEHGIIAHQVHIQHPDGRTPGVFGAGLAKQVKDKYPNAYTDYRCRLWRLGDVQLVPINHRLIIANCAGQLTYGKDKRHTNYGALALCLCKLFDVEVEYRMPLYIPYGMGCGLAGGDWDIVSELIWEIVPQATICRLTKTLAT